MAFIVSSTILKKNIQHDGRFWVTEEHIDNFDKKYERTYLLDANDDAEIRLNEYALIILENEKRREISQNMYDIMQKGVDANIQFSYSTIDDLIQALADEYLSGASLKSPIFFHEYLSSLSDDVLYNILNCSYDEISEIRANKLLPDAEKATIIRNTIGNING